MKSFIALWSTLVLMCACTSSIPPLVEAVQKPVPLIAVAVTQCGGLVALYIVLDDRHMIRASMKALAAFAIQPDGKVAETSSAPIPFDAAMQLALKARIQTRVETACSQPGVST